MQRLLAAFHARCAAVVEGAGGTVAKRLGETVLAYFGYPETHEDEAERAIWAALRLVEAAGAIETEHSGGLQARVGIATGLVLVGDLLGAGAREPMVLGEAPNLAAGLLARAEPGTALISAATRRLVGDTFRYREHAPVALDGLADPLPAWEVIGEGVESRFEALHGHAVTELVGREEELFLLLRRWEQAKAGSGRAVLVTGEPGIGKSRLIRAVLDHLDSEVLWRLRYFCSPHYRDSALHPIIARIEDAADFTRDDTTEAKFAKLKALLARSDASDEAIALVASMLSLPVGEPYRLPEMSPQRLREKTVAALLELFAGLAARRPTLMIVEDVHWSDPTTLELGTRIIERVASMRVLVLMTARPEFKPPWPDQAHVTTLLLNRLSDDEAAALVQHVAGEAPMPGAALRQIVRHAEGVPLFAEELTKAVLESGLPADGERSAPLPVPTSLHDLLLERLDRLGPAREVAQIGAVIGREFTHELLSAVAGQPDPVLEQAMAQLVRSELAFRGGTPPDAHYTFKHALVQQAAYESLPRSRRQELHATIVQALLKHDPALADSQPDLLAWHCEQAGLLEKAIDYYSRAGWCSASRGAYVEGREQCATALHLISILPKGTQRDRMNLEVLACLSGVIVLQRGYANCEAIEVQVRAQELWERLGWPAEFVGVIRDRWMFHFCRGETKLAQNLADKLLHSSQRQIDPRYTIWGHALVGGSAMLRGELCKASSHLHEGLQLMQRCSDDPSYLWKNQKSLRGPWTAWAHITAWLGYTKGWLGYPDEALGRLSSIVERAPAMGWVPALVVYSLLEIQLSSFFTDGSELVQPVKALCKRIGELDLALYNAMGAIYRGYAVSYCGDPEGGIATMHQGLEAYRASETVIWSGYYRSLLAEANQRLGRLHEARRLLVEAQDLAERTGERWYDAELARRLGEMDRQQGDVRAAETRFKQALAIARRQHAKLWELHAATSLARLWHEQRRGAEARAVLAPVYGWFKEGFETSSLRRAKAVLEELEAPLPLRS